MGYRILDHTADIGVEVHGATLADLFSQAAFALVDLLTDRATLTGATAKVIRIEGADMTDLWINYLREILYLFNGENFLLKDIPEINFNAPTNVQQSHTPAPTESHNIPNVRELGVNKSEGKAAELSLEASLRGTPYHPRRHAIKTEIKAVTYHHAEVKQTPEGWQGVFIVDV
ncbi:MAG: archease [Syntrophales bacterium]|jgi:SHS2 domain-containing protein|nr:archease [Syntrophales bacterium]